MRAARRGVTSVLSSRSEFATAGTEYIDLYQLHFPDAKTPVDETLSALDTLVRAGKVRYVGSSNFSGWQLADAAWVAKAKGYTPFISAQNHYNLLDRRIEREVLPAAEAFGRRHYSVFPSRVGTAHGQIQTRCAVPNNFARAAANPDAAKRMLSEDNFAVVEKLEDFAHGRGKGIVRCRGQLAAWSEASLHGDCRCDQAGAGRGERHRRQLGDAAQRLGRDQQANYPIVNLHDPEAEAQFQQAVAKNLTRNYVSQLAHGMLAMTGFRLVNAPTFVPAYLFVLSGSPTVVGLALATQYLGAFFSSVFGATAIEHRRKIVDLGLRYGWAMRLSVLGLALAGFLLPPEAALYAFALCLGLLGVFSGMQNVLWNVLLTKTIPPDRRGMLIGLRNFLGGMTAAGVAYVGGKYLVEQNVLGNGYATTFLLAFVLTAAGLTLLYLVREPESPTVRAPVGVRERLADIPALLKDHGFARYFWAQTLATLGTLALPFYVIYVGQTQTAALTGNTVANLSVALLVSQTVANLGWGWLADKMGFKAVFVPALLMWAGATIALLFAQDMNASIFCFVGIGAGYAGFLIAAQNMVLEFGSRDDLPMRIAMVNSAQSLVQVIGAVAGGAIASSLGFEVVFAAAALAMLAAAGMLWFYVQRTAEETAFGGGRRGRG